MVVMFHQNLKFNIVPVFFNIGIDHQAHIAHKQGLNGPQEKNNSDNFKILVEYVRKFKQKNYFNHISKNFRKVSDNLLLHIFLQGKFKIMMRL